MNDWMCKRLRWDDGFQPDRGKVLDAADLATVTRFSRYFTEDDDGVAPRTLPGVHPAGAYFVRGSGHDKHGQYTEDSEAYQEVVDRLKHKFATAANSVPPPDFIAGAPGAEIGIVTIGGCHAAVIEAIAHLREQGINADYMRIKAFPFGPQVKAFLDAHPRIFVVEQNRDAQLRTLLTAETGFPRDAMIPVLDYGGLPLTARVVVDAVAAGVKVPRRSPLDQADLQTQVQQVPA
jgi:2-oxoglutarate ferredoxin oxidoreductase subunit alpha